MTEHLNDTTGCGCTYASRWCRPWKRAAYCGLTPREFQDRNERLQQQADIAEEIG